MKPTLLRTAMLLALGPLNGCGGKAEVSGVVKYRGKPVTDATILFYDSKNEVAKGLIGPDGSYTVKDVNSGPAKIALAVRANIPVPGLLVDKSAKVPEI